MNKTKIGLIGCGKQAYKHITSLKKLPGLELVISDIQSELANDLAKRTNTYWVKHPDEIFTDDSIKAVVISTPTRTHFPLIKTAIECEKDVFCEKPLSDSIEEAIELKQIVGRSKNIAMVGYIYRYVPIFEEGYKLFREQQINGASLVMGRPLSAFFRLGGRGGHRLWKHQKAKGGGAINEMLVHMVDLANWYFGPIEKTEVISCDLRLPERVIQGEKVRLDAEDYILVKCLGASGVEIYCQADLITPAFSQYVEIQSENGSFMGSIQSDMPSHVFLKQESGGFSEGKTVLSYGRRNVTDFQVLVFIHLVLKRELPDRNTIEDSLELIRIISEIERQIEV